MFCLPFQHIFSKTSGETYKLAQPSHKATELYNSPNSFEYPHVCESNFLKQVSVMNKPEFNHTLMYSSLVYSGSLMKGISHSFASQ